MPAEAIQTTIDESLTALFASGARITVLWLFMVDPTRAYYQRQIEAATGLPIRAVQRELERLSSINLLYRHAEGNRTYYRVDTQFPLFSELRTMILKAGTEIDRLRGSLALEPTVQLAFLNEAMKRVLVVTASTADGNLVLPDGFKAESITREEFLRLLSDKGVTLDPYLREGVDILGRRDDVIWRRIEAAGYLVRKGKGVA
ncbi:MAG: hypothetical protein K1Y02_00010 [Candidatus Hydrogenedentes bacterium]|nr:hypothetical protein [Candidatus Hydrogenedentota bacterium]